MTTNAVRCSGAGPSRKGRGRQKEGSGRGGNVTFAADAARRGARHAGDALRGGMPTTAFAEPPLTQTSWSRRCPGGSAAAWSPSGSANTVTAAQHRPRTRRCSRHSSRSSSGKRARCGVHHSTTCDMGLHGAAGRCDAVLAAASSAASSSRMNKSASLHCSRGESVLVSGT